MFGSCIADGGTEVQISSPLLDYITSGKAEEDTQGCQQTPPPVPSHYKCDRRITAEEGGNMCSAYNRQVDGLGTLTILSSSKFSPRDTVCDPTCERLKSFADCCHPDVCQTEIPEECVTAGGIPFVYDVTGGETLCESMRQQGLCDE